MKTYQHTQRGKLIVVVMGVVSAVSILIGLTISRSILAVVPILMLSGWLFHSLTIEITNDELRWRFGPGLIQKCAPLSEIIGAQQVRTNVLEGWGIHLSRFGWLYNVSGYDAVAFTLKNGKRFALGTDEPVKLLAAFAE